VRHQTLVALNGVLIQLGRGQIPPDVGDAADTVGFQPWPAPGSSIVGHDTLLTATGKNEIARRRPVEEGEERTLSGEDLVLAVKPGAGPPSLDRPHADASCHFTSCLNLP
jgi:hypothetical protein